MVRDVLTWTLVAVGLAVQVLTCLGVVLMRDARDRLHYSAASSLGVVCLCAAVLVKESFSLIAIKAILVAAFLLVTGPVLASTTARAIHLHRQARR